MQLYEHRTKVIKLAIYDDGKVMISTGHKYYRDARASLSLVLKHFDSKMTDFKVIP